MHRKILTANVIAVPAFGATACGEEPGTRALSGGAIGAGTILGVAGGRGAGTGVLIGGAAGAWGGALRRPNTIDPGRPIVGH